MVCTLPAQTRFPFDLDLQYRYGSSSNATLARALPAPRSCSVRDGQASTSSTRHLGCCCSCHVSSLCRSYYARSTTSTRSCQFSHFIRATWRVRRLAPALVGEPAVIGLHPSARRVKQASANTSSVIGTKGTPVSESVPREATLSPIRRCTMASAAGIGVGLLATIVVAGASSMAFAPE